MENMSSSLPCPEERPLLAAGLKELLGSSEEERKKYFSSLDAYRTHISVLENQRAEGIEEGRALGKEEGIDLRNKELISRLFSKGKNANEIADLLDLEIKSVQETLASL